MAGCPWGIKGLTQLLRADGASSKGVCVHGLTLKLSSFSSPRVASGVLPRIDTMSPRVFVQTPILGFQNRFAASFLKRIQTQPAKTCPAAFCWTWTMIQKVPPCEESHPLPLTPSTLASGAGAGRRSSLQTKQREAFSGGGKKASSCRTWPSHSLRREPRLTLKAE